MSRWRAVMILMISIVLVLTTAVFLAFSDLVGFTNYSVNYEAEANRLFAYALVLVSGIIGIIYLAGGFKRPASIAKRAIRSVLAYTRAASQSESDQEKFMPLRMALAVEIGIGVLLQLLESTSMFMGHLHVRSLGIVWTIIFASYHVPYVILISLTRIEKFSLAIALTLPGAFLLVDLYRLHVERTLPFFSTVVFMGLQVMVLLVALRLKEHLGTNGTFLLTAAAIVSVVYVVILVFVFPRFGMWLYRIV